MKQATNIIIMALGIAAVVWVGMNFTNESPYHRPQNDAEKALDTALVKVGDDPYAFENMHIRPGIVPNASRVDYSPMLTAKLMAQLAADEKRIVERDCNDVYIEGEICGFDYDPILCAQDTENGYVYMTTHEDATTASIDYSWPMSSGRPEKTVAHYDLIKDKSGWKIDAVTCAFD